MPRSLTPYRGKEGTPTTGNPAAGERDIYPKSDGWYERNSAGVETKVGPSSGGTASNELITRTLLR